MYATSRRLKGRLVEFDMSKLLDEAIDRVRTLSEEQQDDAALNLFAHLAELERQRQESLLTDAQVEEVKRRQAAFRAGSERDATDAEVDGLWRKFER